MQLRRNSRVQRNVFLYSTLGESCVTRPITSLLLALFGFSAIALIAASRGQRLPAGDTKKSVQVGGAAREYALHVPANLPSDGRVPMLLVFHGGGGHAWRMSKFTKFDEIADNSGFVVAYPEAVNKSWDDTRGLSQADDVGFVRTLIEQLEKELPIDSSRVYAA